MVTVTDLARKQMQEVLTEQNVEGLAIRIFVQGGHGGVRYGMGLDDDISADDTVLDFDGIKLVVDADSAPYVEGAEIDFVDALMGRGFTINNPNIPQAGGCGCGGNCGCGHNH